MSAEASESQCWQPNTAECNCQNCVDTAAGNIAKARIGDRSHIPKVHNKSILTFSEAESRQSEADLTKMLAGHFEFVPLEK